VTLNHLELYVIVLGDFFLGKIEGCFFCNGKYANRATVWRMDWSCIFKFYFFNIKKVCCLCNLL